MRYDSVCESIDICSYPIMKISRCTTDGGDVKDHELAFCRRVSNPSVNMKVRTKDGKDRNMQPVEREVMYCNRWFNRLVKRALTVTSDGAELEECKACLNCDKKVYLSNVHLRTTEEGMQFETNCRHFACMSCILRSAFRSRGFGQQPTCIFCRAEYDEDTLIPICVEPKG